MNIQMNTFKIMTLTGAKEAQIVEPVLNSIANKVKEGAKSDDIRIQGEIVGHWFL